MKSDMTSQRNSKAQRGYVLVTVLIITAICLLVAASLIQTAASTASIRRVVQKNTTNFYDVERSINAVTAWLQSNSKNLVTAFNSTNFDNNFALGSPAVGDNEGNAFSPETLIKIKNTNNSVQLTNSSFFGTSAFPATTNIDTGAAFNAASSFAAADFGEGVNVRLLAIWAMQTDGHYEPVFRIDAVTGGNTPEHGVHGFNFVKSALVTAEGGVGYYADMGDFKTNTPNNKCWSYQYSYNSGTNTWSRGAARSNCLITGRDDIQLKSQIYGNVYTLKENGINLDGGAVSGTMCDGSACPVTFTLPNHPNYATRCASVPAVDRTASANPQNLASGDTLAEQCFRTLTVPSNKAFKLTSPDKPYYIQTLNLQNNSNSKLLFDTVGPGHKYTLYVDQFMGGQVNGNQLVGTNLAPHQLEIFITAPGTLRLNGTAAMNAIVTGRTDHTIELLGNFSFFGALRSNAVNVTGNAVLGYDEGLGGAPALTDMNFTLFKASQRYR